MTTIQRRIAVVVAFLLALSVAYYVGKKQGVVDTQLGVNASQIGVSDSTTKTVQIRTDSSRKKDAVLDSLHDVIRNRIKVVHDTVYAPSDISSDTTDEAIYSPAIAHLIATDDSLISAQKHSLALQDTLNASLRVGIALRDERIELLESRGTSRFSHGIQLGLGYCQTALSRTPCAYVGYGIQVRLP